MSVGAIGGNQIPNRGVNPAPPNAAKLADGVHGGNIHEITDKLADTSAMTLEVLDPSVRTTFAKDMSQLKVQLGARLSEQQMGTALMAAGAIIGGPHGVVMHELQGKLQSTLASPVKLDALADQIKHFGDRAQGEKVPTRGDVFESMNTKVTTGLVGRKVGGENVPTGSFFAGALANAYQDHGGYILNL